VAGSRKTVLNDHNWISAKEYPTIQLKQQVEMRMKRRISGKWPAYIPHDEPQEKEPPVAHKESARSADRDRCEHDDHRHELYTESNVQ
jgi:hypothetical protein